MGEQSNRRMDKYDVVFKGEVMPDQQVEQVVIALARAFNSTEARVATLFSGGSKVLKADLEREAAEKYREVLKRAGAIVYLRRSGLPEKPRSSLKRGPASTAISVAPLGGNLVRDDERTQVDAIEVDTSAIALAAVTDEPLQPPAKPTPPPVSTNPDLSLAEPGADLLPPARRQAATAVKSTVELSLAPAGTAAMQTVAGSPPLPPDTSHLQVEPQGNLLKPHEMKTAAEPRLAPDFDLEPPE